VRRKENLQMFDFNGDGKTDLDEQYTAYKIYEDVTKDSGTPAPARGRSAMRF
jgi:hypothetical protein